MPRQPPEDAARHVLRGTASRAWAHQARIRLLAAADVVAQHDRVSPASGLLTPLDEHSCLLETGTNDLRDLARYLIGLDVDFLVVDPPELRTVLRAVGQQCLAAGA